MQRREFMKAAAVAGVAAATTSEHACRGAGWTRVPVRWQRSAEMQYRPLGRTGETVSAVGLGGYHIGIQPGPGGQRAADPDGDRPRHQLHGQLVGLQRRRQRRAHGRRAEGRLSQESAADDQDRRAQQAVVSVAVGGFAAAAEGGHDRPGAVPRDHPLRGPGPHLCHAAARWKRRWRRSRRASCATSGFTGHKDPEIHLRMFEIAKQHDFHFDTVQMPVNVMDAHFRSFAKQVIPVANEQGTAVLAMKTMAGGAILQSNTVKPLEALKYALSQQVAVAIFGMNTQQTLDQGFEAIKDFKPLTETETASILDRTREAAMTGRYEAFKTTARVDGTARRPDWLG